MPKKTCQLCGQNTDIYTSVHKKIPFANGKNYDLICFTCFFVPKIAEQKYREDGSLDEELEIPYSCHNMNTPNELHRQGASETLRQAHVCFEAVRKACSGAKTPKKAMRRPEPSWQLP